MHLKYIYLGCLLFFIFSRIFFYHFFVNSLKGKLLTVNKNPDLFSPRCFFPFFFVLIYGFSNIELSDWERKISDGDFFYYFLGIVFYYLGLRIFQVLHDRKPCLKFTFYKNENLEAKLIWFLYFLTSLVGIFVFIKTGNPLFSDDTENARVEVIRSVGGWVYFLYRTHAIIFVFLIAFAMRNFQKRFSKIYLLASIWSSLLIISSGYRGQLLTVIFTLLIFYNYNIKKIRLSQATIIFSLLFILFMIAGTLRSFGPNVDESDFIYKTFVEIQNPANALSRIIEKVPSEISHFNGLLLLSAFLALLPGEQLAYGLILKDLFNTHQEGGGFTPSILGGFYLDFGFWGIVFGMFIIGYLIMKFYKKSLQSNNMYDWVFYSYIIVYFVNSIRGGILQDIFPIWFFLVTLFFKKAFSREVIYG